MYIECHNVQVSLYDIRIYGSIVSEMQELGHSEVVHGESCTQRKYRHFLFLK